MDNSKNNLFFLFLMIMVLGLSSCSSSKNVTASTNSEELTDMKEALTFKTHFGAAGEMTIKATNNGIKTLDISKLTVIIDQANSDQYKVYLREDLGMGSQIESNQMVMLELSLEKRIKEDFNDVAGKYNVMLTYDSQKAIDHTDERSVYFFTYAYSKQ